MSAATRRVPSRAWLVTAGLSLVVAACASTSIMDPTGGTTPSSAPTHSSPGGLSSPSASSASTSASQTAGEPSASPSTPPPATPSSGSGIPFPPAAPVVIGPASAHGTVIVMSMAAPWRGGLYMTLNVAIYLPPQFNSSGATRYPVIYEAPYGISTWSQPGRFNLALAMDSMIANHLVPPEMVVMMGTSGGPYRASECADSFDGRAKIETWIVKTLVPWVDSHYPTVASRVGRAFMGASQGGYCAAALWSHHPDVFGAAIIESGYFQSGVKSSQTPIAYRTFGNNAAYEAKQSPILVVPKISARLRASSLVLLEADLSNFFYGKQVNAFIPVLARAGVPWRLYADMAGHSWVAFARDTPRMLVDWARWLALQGVK